MMKIKIAVGLMLICIVIACGNNGEPSAENTPAATNDSSTVQTKSSMKTIVFFGNSITAGFGLELSQAFPALIQKRIDSLNLPYKVINAGVSGETSSGGYTRIDWLLKQPVDIFVLELGGNDGLRGIPLTETKKNLQLIIDKVKAKYPKAKIILAGMEIPPNMGPAYTAEFRSIFPELAKKNNVGLIPFILKGVGGEPKLNLEDGIHPTAEGHEILAKNVWEELEGVL